MGMARKDFELIANTLRASRDLVANSSQFDSVIGTLANVFTATYPRFDIAKFITAVYMEEPEVSNDIDGAF